MVVRCCEIFLLVPQGGTFLTEIRVALAMSMLATRDLAGYASDTTTQQSSCRAQSFGRICVGFTVVMLDLAVLFNGLAHAAQTRHSGGDRARSRDRQEFDNVARCVGPAEAFLGWSVDKCLTSPTTLPLAAESN
ncbi:hypothetical protein LTR48_007975 [Friedmanniomyces endolithicus]|nr:hypothetical protein LTR29_009497 [Friedmanniomyces endolithicus]KAK1079841.1 hypothetical protein LTR48_007975 [Friedmanniomyces endolithicus]